MMMVYVFDAGSRAMCTAAQAESVNIERQLEGIGSNRKYKSIIRILLHSKLSMDIDQDGTEVHVHAGNPSKLVGVWRVEGHEVRSFFKSHFDCDMAHEQVSES